MKILIIFCDMLRASDLNSFGTTKSRCELDDLLEELGGTFYTNCYSPAPDTPRGLASFYTGLYPKGSGCTSRIEWPRFYLKQNIETIFSYFNSQGYTIDVNFTENEIRVGAMREQDIEKCTNHVTSKNLIASLGKIFKSDDSLVFLNLQDYHFAVDDFFAHRSAHQYGACRLAKALSKVFSNIFMDEIDELVIFSDHGCLFSSDKFRYEEEKILGDHRTQTVLYRRTKGQFKSIKSERLSTIMDIFPTLIEKTGKKNGEYLLTALDGKSLENEEGHISVVIEDHTRFTPSVGGMPSIWGVKLKNSRAFVSLENIYCYKQDNCSGTYLEYKADEATKQYFTKEIAKVSDYYPKLKSEHQILLYYKGLNEKTLFYADGVKRKKRILFRILTILLKLKNRVFR